MVRGLFGKLSLSDIPIRNNEAMSDRASDVAKVPSKWRGRRKRTEFRPCWRVTCGMSLHPAGNIQMRVPHCPIDLQRHPTLISYKVQATSYKLQAVSYKL